MYLVMLIGSADELSLQLEMDGFVGPFQSEEQAWLWIRSGVAAAGQAGAIPVKVESIDGFTELLRTDVPRTLPDFFRARVRLRRKRAVLGVKLISTLLTLEPEENDGAVRSDER